MSLRLYFHPLSSFCQKVLIALYENDTPFELRMLAPECIRHERAVREAGRVDALGVDAEASLKLGNHIPDEAGVIHAVFQRVAAAVAGVPGEQDPG